MMTLNKHLRFNDNACIPLYNKLFHHIMNSLKIELVEQDVTDADPVLKHKYIPKNHVWPGVVQAIHRHQNSLQLRCIISQKTLLDDTAYQILTFHLCNTHLPKVTRVQAARHELIGQIILTKYNMKTYVIIDIDVTSTPLTSFQVTPADRQFTYRDFYRTTYGITIRDSSQ